MNEKHKRRHKFILNDRKSLNYVKLCLKLARKLNENEQLYDCLRNNYFQDIFV